MNSFQKTDNLVQFGGVADLPEQPLTAWDETAIQGMPITKSIAEDKIIAVIFENSVFPFTGVVANITTSTGKCILKFIKKTYAAVGK